MSGDTEIEAFGKPVVSEIERQLAQVLLDVLERQAAVRSLCETYDGPLASKILEIFDREMS